DNLRQPLAQRRVCENGIQLLIRPEVDKQVLFLFLRQSAGLRVLTQPDWFRFHRRLDRRNTEGDSQAQEMNCEHRIFLSKRCSNGMTLLALRVQSLRHSGSGMI